MNRSFYLLVLCAVVAFTSCNMIWNKVDESFKQMGDQQSLIADSMRIKIIGEKSLYEKDLIFTAKMDTVYASGLRLADLVDSLRRYPNNYEWQMAYNKELKFFRNYVNHHFDYSDDINSGYQRLGLWPT